MRLQRHKERGKPCPISKKIDQKRNEMSDIKKSRMSDLKMEKIKKSIPRNCDCIDSRDAKHIVRFQGREKHCPISDSCPISDFAGKNTRERMGRERRTKSPKKRTQDP